MPTAFPYNITWLASSLNRKHYTTVTIYIRLSTAIQKYAISIQATRIRRTKICQAIKAIEYERMLPVIVQTQLCQVQKREPSKGTKFALGENPVMRLVV
jgi:hypothetical protein